MPAAAHRNEDQRRLLVADDDASIRQLMKTFLEGEGYDVLEASSGSEILKQLDSDKRPELVVMDLRMPETNGIEVLEKLRSEHSEVGAILMTAYGTANTAIQAIQMGAFDYVTKPFELDDVLLTIQRYFEYQDLTAEVQALRSELTIGQDPMEKIVGNSPKMQDIYKMVGRVARSDATVLIWGETGTGKELVANAMHYNSSHRNGPFIKVNCAALPETLLESELFGHEKGAFTGALIQRKGRFELANHGSIFLDEIGEMTMNTQRKLLRVLQEREFERVGSSTPIKVDVRIIAATNRDLAKDVQEGRFREDLFYRLNVIAVHMPPLREKKEDIPDLVAYFCNKHRFTDGADPSQVSDEAMDLIMGHEWPGNVRELENVIERAVVTAQGGLITPDHL
ncbi:MAG TPA: sigma-54 dependent transcriptional regulator, partial [Chloroflexota bacterium]|nr:sigma-54 dependent transcriptional regulator [Chloroflexota bacterium]